MREYGAGVCDPGDGHRRIHGNTTEPGVHTKKGFLAFLEDVLSGLSASETLEYRGIMDNHSIHKRHEVWQAHHPNQYCLIYFATKNQIDAIPDF